MHSDEKRYLELFNLITNGIKLIIKFTRLHLIVRTDQECLAWYNYRKVSLPMVWIDSMGLFVVSYMLVIIQIAFIALTPK